MKLYFLEENLAGSATQACVLVPYAGNEFFAQRNGRVRSLTALVTELWTAGTLTVKVTKNGTAQTVLNCLIDTTNRQFDEAFGDLDDLTYSAGDRIGVQAVTSGWTPTTSDLLAILDLDD